MNDTGRLVLATFLAAILSAVGSFVAFARNTPNRGEVRTMISEETSNINRQHDELITSVFDLTREIHQAQADEETRFDTTDQKLIDIEHRLQAIEDQLQTLPLK
jgi:flagellar capping protein FliD